jgi:hypothetical protein
MSRDRSWIVAPVGVGVILLASYAYFWQARDWNVSSRLMLTYALADRGTVSINGLEDHTRDRARIGREYYSDKLPGLSLLAIPPYLAAKTAFGLPDHPLNRPGVGFTHWPSDYFATLGTSGLATAMAGSLLTILAMRLGCGPRRAALVGLAYGLATPAYAYATLAYGHQATALLLLAAWWLVMLPPEKLKPGACALLAGLAASGAVSVELQVAPAAAVIGLALLARVIRRDWPARCLIWFALGAAGPLLIVAGYNILAFGSPLDLGYFHEDLEQFGQVHSESNPLGLRGLAWSRLGPLLWGRYRGLSFYAPIVLLAVPGWIVLGWRRRWGVLLTTLGVAASILAVNLSYPEWTGGWSTGPRLLVPSLPFAMIAVAALLATGNRFVVLAAIGLTLAGAGLMLLFLGVGARVPQEVADPLVQVVWPSWRGSPLPPWAEGRRFTRTAAEVLAPGWVRSLGPRQAWRVFPPLVGFQTIAVAGLMLILRPKPDASGGR